jgi:hypothetical protein
MIVALAIAGFSLFMQVRWLNILVIGVCGVAVAIFLVIIGFSEALCVRRITSGVPWPTVVLVVVHMMRAMFTFRWHE